MKKYIVLILSGTFLATGCSVFQVKVPSTTVSITPNNGGIMLTSPKDGVLSGLDITFTQSPSNSNYHVTVASLSYTLNPTNVIDAANGQTAIINAAGVQIANGINATATAIGAAAGVAAKTAVK